MNNKGFTLIEMLACVALLAFVFTLGLIASRDTLATSLSQTTSISDNQIRDAASLYAIEVNKNWTNGTACVTVKELVDYGYLDSDRVSSKINRIVEITRDTKTKAITSIDYVDECSY